MVRANNSSGSTALKSSWEATGTAQFNFTCILATKWINQRKRIF
jgi:hypothetical protein